MRSARIVLSTLVILLLGASLVGVSYASTYGFAAYGVNATYHGMPWSLTLNESVAPTSNQVSSQFVLKAVANGWNFNYSRSINSSLVLFPFVPAISNQSFAIARGQNDVWASVAQNGTVPLTFQGSTYVLTSYEFSAHFAANGSTGFVTGVLYTFPSGLVYSLKANGDGMSSVAVTLLSTSLPLKAGTSSTSALQMASAGLGAGAIVSVVLLSLGIRHKRQASRSDEKKPDYWVD